MADRAEAQAVFLPATDARLRSDVLLLADEGVISLPTNAWPIPAGDLAGALRSVRADEIGEPALLSAFNRLAERMSVVGSDGWRVREASVTGGRAPLLRSYGAFGRDELEIASSVGVADDRWGLTVAATGVASPDDGRHLRLDGSDATVRWGNWLFSANQLDRWWGPGWEGSLVLSTNARPMPALSLDRNRSEPFDFPVLRRLGPWRFSAFLARMEEHRADVDRPLFMGMRLSFKPLQILELGLSRTAQFCGNDRPCNATTFWNVLFGQDNVGIRVSKGEEPGNQMAGIDIRIASPVQALPVALYGQFIGEDNSSTGIPERYLGMLGVEGWTLLGSASALRWRIEYANTNCKFTRPTVDLPEFSNCAYRQAVFTAGYRYRGRSIGHSADADSEIVSASVNLAHPSGDALAFTVRRALLDRYGGPDLYNPLTEGPGKVLSLEASASTRFRRSDLAVRIGYDDYGGGAQRSGDRLVGFLQWRLSL